MFHTIYQDLPGIQPWISLFAAIWNIQHDFFRKKVISPQKKQTKIDRTKGCCCTPQIAVLLDREQME